MCAWARAGSTVFRKRRPRTFTANSSSVRRKKVRSTSSRQNAVVSRQARRQRQAADAAPVDRQPAGADRRLRRNHPPAPTTSRRKCCARLAVRCLANVRLTSVFNHAPKNSRLHFLQFTSADHGGRHVHVYRAGREFGVYDALDGPAIRGLESAMNAQLRESLDAFIAELHETWIFPPLIWLPKRSGMTPAPGGFALSAGEAIRTAFALVQIPDG